MAKETKEMLKTILANTQAIMKHLSIDNKSTSDKKQAGKDVADKNKSAKKISKPVKKNKV